MLLNFLEAFPKKTFSIRRFLKKSSRRDTLSLCVHEAAFGQAPSLPTLEAPHHRRPHVPPPSGNRVLSRLVRTQKNHETRQAVPRTFNGA